MSKFFEVTITKVETVVVELSDKDCEEFDNFDKAIEVANWEVSDGDTIDSWDVKELTDNKVYIESAIRHCDHKVLLEEE